MIRTGLRKIESELRNVKKSPTKASQFTKGTVITPLGSMKRKEKKKGDKML